MMMKYLMIFLKFYIDEFIFCVRLFPTDIY